MLTARAPLLEGRCGAFPFWEASLRRIGDIVAETAAWSPNGKMLAYSNLGDLFLARSDGTESRKLLTVKGDIKNIAWSPDSSHLRFDTTETAGTLGQQLEWEVPADGTGPASPARTAGTIPPNECCGKWTADGKYFVFQSNSQIWALPQKARTFSPRAEAHSADLPALCPCRIPLPSKDGKKLFVIGQTYRGELMRYDSKSGQFAPFLGGISAEYIAFSKDGQWVAYVSYRDGALWRSKVDGSERLQLTFPPMYPVLPRWSPDGKKSSFLNSP